MSERPHLLSILDNHRIDPIHGVVKFESAKYKTKWKEEPEVFPFEQMVAEGGKQGEADKPAEGSLRSLIGEAKLPPGRDPLTLEFGG